MPSQPRGGEGAAAGEPAAFPSPRSRRPREGLGAGGATEAVSRRSRITGAVLVRQIAGEAPSAARPLRRETLFPHAVRLPHLVVPPPSAGQLPSQQQIRPRRLLRSHASAAARCPSPCRTAPARRTRSASISAAQSSFGSRYLTSPQHTARRAWGILLPTARVVLRALSRHAH